MAKQKTNKNWKNLNDPPENVHRWFGQYFCGCGDPEAGMATFKEVLGWFKTREGGTSHMISLDAIKPFEDRHGTGLLMVLLYFIGGTGLTEHGGSVYGCWLTKLGEEVKTFLDENPDYEP